MKCSLIINGVEIYRDVELKEVCNPSWELCLKLFNDIWRSAYVSVARPDTSQPAGPIVESEDKPCN